MLLTMPRILWLASLTILLPHSFARAESPVSFRNEAQAVLSRAGCNQGACHGNLNGKGGFKLSLRGEDADFDYTALTREMMGRRVSISSPKESLILQKASGQMPHEGGVRFSPDSYDYRILLRWIEAGAKPDPGSTPHLRKLTVSPKQRILLEPDRQVQLQASAEFDDGTVQDVRHLVAIEPTSVGMVTISSEGMVTGLQDGEVILLVRYLGQQVPVKLAFVPDRPDFRWEEIALKSPIDQSFYQQFKSLKLQPSQLADDSQFLRRAFLDTIGLLPSVEEVRTFLADKDTDKRAKLIDSLLQRPEFADYWALKWSDILHNEEKTLDKKGVRVFHQWIRQSILEGKPLNRFAQEIVSAKGSTYENPPTNFYRAIRAPYDRAEAVAQVFLGIRLQCARCHNHPFDRWTQNEYHEFASLFSQIDYRIVENNRRDRLDSHEFDGEQLVIRDPGKKLLHPRTSQPLQPRLLAQAKYLPLKQDRLNALGEWIARRDNPFFAPAQVNRIWYHLLGRGLVDPNDDLRVSTPPINQEVFDLLVKEFIDHDFDLRHLIRTIMNTRVYQLSAIPNSTNEEDETHFSRALVQPLEAEPLLDSICRVLNTSVKFNTYPRGTRATEVAAPVAPPGRRDRSLENAEKFLRVFGKPERLLTCECERSDDTGLLQAFQLINGELVNQLIGEPSNRLGKLLELQKTDAEIIQEFYLAALSRYPTETERDALTKFVAKSPARRAALEDVIWGLLNSKEFLLRR